MEEKYSRPATFEDLKSLLRALSEHCVDYLLIGGYALYAHGYHRATTDIDLLVPAERATGEKLKRALLVLPDKAAQHLDPEWFVEGETIRVADEFVVDVMFNACGETYDTLRPFAEDIVLDDGTTLRTVNLQGLLKTKQSVREKDKLDRAILEQALAGRGPE